MHRKTRLKINPTLNPHLICVLCGGYYIDATTIVECLHSFCKTCIVRYLETSKFCPICDVQVHKTKPFTNIRLDHTLQDVVYKLVPGLFKVIWWCPVFIGGRENTVTVYPGRDHRPSAKEMKRRREFYKEHLDEHATSMLSDANRCEYYIDEDGEIQRERVIFSNDEQISLALQLSPDGKPPKSMVKAMDKRGSETGDCRYLLCPAAVTIAHLKKFIRMKFNLSDRYQIDVYHTDELLDDSYTLIDVAYIYLWRRKGPLALYYTVYTNQAKKFKREISCTETTDIGEHQDDPPNQVDKVVQNTASQPKEEPSPRTTLESNFEKEQESEKIPTQSSFEQEKPSKTEKNGKEILMSKTSCCSSTSVAKGSDDAKLNSKDKLELPRDCKVNGGESLKLNVSTPDKNRNEKIPNTKEDTLPHSPIKVIKSNSITNGQIISNPDKCSKSHKLDSTSSAQNTENVSATVTTSDTPPTANRVPKPSSNKYSNSAQITNVPLTTPIYHPRQQPKPASSSDKLKISKQDSSSKSKSPKTETPLNSDKKLSEKVFSSSNLAKSPKTLSPSNEDKIKVSKPTQSSSSGDVTPSKSSPSIAVEPPCSPRSSDTEKSTLSNSHNLSKTPTLKNGSNFSTISTQTAASSLSANDKTKHQKAPSNGQKEKPATSFTPFTNGLTIPSPIGLPSSVTSFSTSSRPFNTAPLHRTLSSSPTRRKTASPSRRLPVTSTTNGRLTPGPSISPSSIYSLSPSPTNRNFPTSPTAHSFSSTGRIFQTSPLARQMSSPTGRIFSFPERGPIMHLPITVPNAHSHSNLRLNSTSPVSNNASPLNGDLPQDLSIKKRHASGNGESTTLKIPIKVPIKANGLLPNGEVDKFAFTDDDDVISPLKCRKLHPIKTEPSSGT